CTLADAVTAANTGVATGGCPAGDSGSDTLVLDADVTLDDVDPLSSEQQGSFAALPDITSDVTVRAGAASTIRRNPAYTCTTDTADPVFRFFNVTAGSLVLENVDLVGACLAGVRATGAVILSSLGTSLTLTGVTVDGATAKNAASSIQGAAVYSFANSVTISDSRFRNVHAEATGSLQGGVVYLGNSLAAAEVRGTAFQEIEADAQSTLQGGAIYASISTLDLVDVTFEDFEVSGSSLQGGAVHRANGDSFTWSDGAIHEVRATATSSLNGAAIYSSLTTDSSIDDLEASDITGTAGSAAEGGVLYGFSTSLELRHVQASDVALAVGEGACSGGALWVRT
ncbi:MAG: hypothetical protein AAFX50_25780, partial [Acidobacteriota bacterium]